MSARPRSRPSLRRLAPGLAAAAVLAACGGAGGGPARAQSAEAPPLPPVVRSLTAEGEGQIGAPVKPGSSASGNYLAGRHAQSAHDYGRAADYFSRALALQPGSEPLVRRTFAYMVMDGRVNEALPLAREVMEKGEKDTVAHLAVIVHAVKNGRFEAALDAIAHMPEGGINVFLAPLLESWVHVGLGRPDEALAILDGIEETNGLAALRDLHAALIHQSQGDFDTAAELYAGSEKGASGLSLRLTELLGDVYLRAGEPGKARQVYEAYRHAHPGSVLITPLIDRLNEAQPTTPAAVSPQDGVAEALFGMASSLRQQGAQDTALVFSRLALYLRPDFPIAQILLADILEAEGRLAEANRVYAAIDPASPFAWPGKLRAASNLNEMERVDEAVAILEAMARERPDQADPLVQLGDLLRTHKRFSEAVAAYDRAEGRMEGGKSGDWSFYYVRGIALERADDWQRAEQDFLRALKLEPQQPYVLNYLGYTWVEKGKNLERAQEMIEQAVEIRPRDGYIVDSLGWVLYRLGDMQGAVKNLERAVELRPDDPVINDHLGDAYWRVGRRQEARFQWKRALSFDPEPDVAATIRTKLDKGLQDDATDAGSR